MFSYELDNYIKGRLNSLTPQEYIFVTDIRQHPQINHMKFNVENNTYDIWTDDNYHWNIIIIN